MPLHTRKPNKKLIKELERDIEERVSVLAHGTGENVTVFATRTLLAVKQNEQWHTWGWHEIITGRWNASQSTFQWTTTGGESLEIQLESVGRLPELFQERVQASIAVTESHDLERGSIQIIGRRSLGGSNEMTWYTTASGGADLNDPATRQFVVRRTDELDQEWGQLVWLP